MVHPRSASLVAVVLAASLSTGSDAASAKGGHLVGHTTLRIVHAGAHGEVRPVDVHVWYPALKRDFSRRSASTYHLRLHGVPLIPGTYDSLSWRLISTAARDDVPIDRERRFPLLILSHGSGNDPTDYAYTAERIASHGYVVAAPAHTGHSQDDNLADFANATAGRQIVPCLDSLPAPCADADPRTLTINRTGDIRAVIESFERGNDSRFRDRIDRGKIGILGHSAGAQTALLAVAGLESWGVPADSRIKGVLTMAFPTAYLSEPDVASALATVRVPLLMMAGTLDRTSTVAMSQFVYDSAVNASRELITLRGAHHRSFNSTFCDRMQVAGAIAQSNPRAILENRQISRTVLLTDPSGSTIDYCAFASFSTPANIVPYIASLSEFTATPANVPRSGLLADAVTRVSADLTADFFGQVFSAAAPRDGDYFRGSLQPRTLLRDEASVATAVKSVVARQ